MSRFRWVILGGWLGLAVGAAPTPPCDTCGKQDRDATAGVYKVNGAYLLKSRGEGVETHIIQATYSGTVLVPDLGPERGSGSIQTGQPHEVTMEGMASVFTFGGSVSRPEPRKGQLEGALSGVPALLYLKGDDMSFRINITQVDCAKVSGVLVLDEETPLELLEAVEAQGLTVLEHVGTFEAILDRSTEKAALVREAEQACGDANVAEAGQVSSAIANGMAAIRSLKSQDPYERCLQYQIFREMGCLLSRRAKWLIDRFTQGRWAIEGPRMQRSQLRTIISTVKAAELMGCTMDGAFDPIARQFGWRAIDAGRSGESAVDLVEAAAIADQLGYEGADGARAMEGVADALNARAEAAGQPHPFPNR